MSSESAFARTSENDARAVASAPLLDGHVEGFAVVDPCLEGVGNGLGVGLETGFGLPDLRVAGVDRFQQVVEASSPVGRIGSLNRLADERHHPGLFEPGDRRSQIAVRNGEQQMAANVVQAEIVQCLLDREESDPVARQVRVGRSRMNG